MDKYDGIIFGNGASKNLLDKITYLFPQDKQYLLNIDEFLHYLIQEKLNKREENRIFNILYKKKAHDSLKGFYILKEELSRYYNQHNSDIEYHLGVDMFREEECDYDYSLIKSIFPFLYNIWHQILFEYFEHLGVLNNICAYSKSMSAYFENNCRVFTTNFDRFAEAISPDHLHGRFILPYKNSDDIILKKNGEKEIWYKCIWGWNGVGKLKTIEVYNGLPDIKNYFDFDFFYSKELIIRRLLIYGVGFRTSGYIEELSKSQDKYKNPVFGGIIDEHILARLNGLQTTGQLEEICFAYHSVKDKQHFAKLTDSFELKNVRYINSNAFNFDIK